MSVIQLQRSSGIPMSSAITWMGSGSAIDDISSGAGSSAMPRSSRSTIAATRGSSRCIFLGVNIRLTAARSRVCSGGSVNSSALRNSARVGSESSE